MIDFDANAHGTAVSVLKAWMDSRGREDVPGSGSVDGDIGSVGSFDRGFERAAADVADASSSSSSSQHEAESIAVVKVGAIISTIKRYYQVFC